MINIIDKLLEDWKKQNDISGLVVNDNGFIEMGEEVSQIPDRRREILRFL